MKQSKFFQTLEKGKENAMLQQSVCPVVVVSSDPFARKVISRFLKQVSDIDIMEAQSA